MGTGPDSSFAEYLEEAIGRENAGIAFSALGLDPSVSVRLNPMKPGAEFDGLSTAVPWCRHGLMLDGRPKFTLDPCFHAGGYYVQDSSSMFTGHIFRDILQNRLEMPQRPIRVLDLCAAPGGKTTDLASSLREATGDMFMLVANEVMRQRASVLADNIAIWGDPNVTVTSSDPERFGQLKGMFDIILADVPCSGEGMFRKDAKAREQWSEETVALCQARQRRIIADVWDSLAAGGILIYSTCTFNRLENDGNVEWICRTLGAEPLYPGSGKAGDFPGVMQTGYGFLLVPGFVKGEGQYCSAVMKTGSSKEDGRQEKVRRKTAKPQKKIGGALPGNLFKEKVRISQNGSLTVAVPEVIADDVETVSSCLSTLRRGCTAGSMKGRDFIPDADLALSVMLSEEAFPRAELDLRTALAFLHRDRITVNCQEKGHVLVCYRGLPLGFVKNLGNRCNSLHPMNRRIRMDIE